MKKEILFPGLALLGGLAGFALRWRQLSAAVDPSSGIIQMGHPATLGLLALTALMLLAFLLLPQGARPPEGPRQAFFCPTPLYMSLMAAAGLLLLAAGALHLMELSSQAAEQMGGGEPIPFLQAVPLLALLGAALCLPAGASVLILGRYNYRGAGSPAYPVGSLAPGYLALLLLIRYYVGCSSDPLLLRYAWSLLGWVSTLLAAYLISSCCYRRPAPRKALFFSGAAIYFQLVSLADRPGAFQCAASLALILYLLAQGAGLARNCFGAPRMPPGAQGNEGPDPNKIDE